MKLDCVNINEVIPEETDFSPFRIEIKNRKGESENTNRIFVENDDVKAELLPSKGMSVGEVFFSDRPLFWEPPIGLPDPEKIDLLGNKVLINGSELEGFDYLETFMGGIEFYGLRNWGMSRTKNTKIYPLHGETSNIPVKEAEIVRKNKGICVSGSFIYHSMDGNAGTKWHLSGKKLYHVVQSLFIPNKGKMMTFKTTIENLSGETLMPDWGYHITFKPENGSKLIVPSKHREMRGGSVLPEEMETWHPAKNDKIRTETGIIHKELLTENGKAFILFKYTDGKGVKFTFPASPYFQTWFCNGGANSSEFTYRDGKPVFNRNWDGQGVEIGSSSLDHDGNIDQTVKYESELKAGAVKEIKLQFELLDETECTQLEKRIREYNTKKKEI
jgi:hypothetical protein